MKFKSKWYFQLIEKLILILFGLWTLIPIYIIVSNAFKRPLDISEMPPKFLFTPDLSHFISVLTLDNFGKYFFNSLVISVTVTIATIFIGTLAAYGLNLFQSKIGERISNIMLMGKLVPSITIVIPLYIMLNSINLVGTYIAPILAHTAIELPFVMWLMTGFIRDIPNELLESAKVMGCTRMKAFFLIIFPLLSPAIGSATILTMQYSWNELMYSLTLTNFKTYTLTVGIARYVGAMSVDWGKCSAAATITIVPIIIVGFFMQKYLVVGMTSGAVKG